MTPSALFDHLTFVKLAVEVVLFVAELAQRVILELEISAAVRTNSQDNTWLAKSSPVNDMSL